MNSYSRMLFQVLMQCQEILFRINFSIRCLDKDQDLMSRSYLQLEEKEEVLDKHKRFLKGIM